MQTLEFNFDWEAASGIKGPELASTWASLRIRVNNSVLTRVLDPSDNRVRDCIHLPLYPLAEWLATSCWFLLHESEDRMGNSDLPFMERHALGPSREGYRFPNIHVVSFDTETRVTWKHDRLRWSGLEFLDREGCEWIDKDGFRQACAGLVDAVVERLMSRGVRNTLLEEEWQAIRDADEEEQRFCQMAGALGLDPYSIDPRDRTRVFRIEKALSGAVLEEALPILHVDRLDTELAAIARVLKVGKAASIPLERFTSLRDEVVDLPLSHGDNRPWGVGYSLARQVRAGLGLDGTPLPSWPSLSRALSEPRLADGRLSRSRAFHRAGRLDGVVTSNDDGLPGFCFRPGGTSRTRRFRFCRGLAELLSRPRSDALLTRARSSRQQMGRAFAAEFLAPSAGLRECVHGHALDEEEVADLASRFGVSALVVERQIENHGIARIGRRDHRGRHWAPNWSAAA